jgi:MoxR-like ATPase
MTDNTDIELLKKLDELRSQFFNEIGKSIIGQHHALDHILIALLCKGHTLIVGVPGLAKTLMIKSLADILDLNFQQVSDHSVFLKDQSLGILFLLMKLIELLQKHRQHY